MASSSDDKTKGKSKAGVQYSSSAAAKGLDNSGSRQSVGKLMWVTNGEIQEEDVEEEGPLGSFHATTGKRQASPKNARSHVMLNFMAARKLAKRQSHNSSTKANDDLFNSKLPQQEKSQSAVLMHHSHTEDLEPSDEWSSGEYLVSGVQQKQIQASEIIHNHLINRERLPQFPIGSTLIDPFSTAVFHLDSDMQKLIQRYLLVPQSVGPIMSYKPITQPFILGMAISDEALLHSVLAYAAMHNACYENDSMMQPSRMKRFVLSDPKFLYHQLQAVRLINKQLKEGNISDALISAVLVLVWRHSWTGGTKETDTHYAGLQELVRFRGGLESLPRLLVVGLTFLDQRYAIRTHSKPAFPSYPADFKLIKSFDYSVSNSKSGMSLEVLFSNLRGLLGEELHDLLIEFHRFTAFVDRCRFLGTECSPEHHRYFDDWSISINHRLLSYPKEKDVVPTLFDPIFKDGLRTAILLWSNTALWRFRNETAIVRSIARHLTHLLKQSHLESWKEISPDLIIWIVVIGGCSSEESNPRSFFVNEMKAIVTSGVVTSQQDVHYVLKRFLYLDGMYGPQLSRFCEEVWLNTMDLE